MKKPILSPKEENQIHIDTLIRAANQYLEDKCEERIREKETLMDKLNIHLNGKEIIMENYSKG